MPHRTAAGMLRWYVSQFQFTPADRVANHAALSFDLSVYDMFGCFHAGATLCPVTRPGDAAFPGRFIREERISVWFSVPAVLGNMLATGQLVAGAFAPHLRLALFAGEALRPDFAAAWLSTHPDVPLHNLYGPTEAGVCSFFRVRSDQPLPPGRSVPIGRPTPGMEFVILQREADVRAAPGAIGRLMLRGWQLSPGYWRRPEVTARAFRPDPLQTDSAAVLYDTGDLVWEDAQGIFHFAGRLDTQVKIQGYRVELGEIEHTLCAHPDVAEAAVLLLGEDDPHLVAVIAPAPRAAETTPETTPETSGDLEARLRILCRDVLAPYKAPRRYVILPALPKNINGKIDRRALRERLLSLTGAAAP